MSSANVEEEASEDVVGCGTKIRRVNEYELHIERDINVILQINEPFLSITFKMVQSLCRT